MNTVSFYLVFVSSLSMCLCDNSSTMFSFAKWHFEEIQRSVNHAITLATQETKSYLHCYLYCTYLEIPYIISLYYTPDTRICYCNSQLDSRPWDSNSNVMIYGAPGLYIKEKKEKNKTEEKTKKVVWPYIPDCLGLYKYGFFQDSIYSILGWEGKPIYANCDMKNGGWTIVQHRFDGSVSFNRNWLDYRLGFGDILGEHWIGLENIHYLTQTKSSMLIYMEAFPGDVPSNATSYYEFFKVHDEASKFRIEASDDIYSSNCKYRYSKELNGREFYTPDRDNAALCAITYKTGYWFGGSDCGYDNLHGGYFDSGEYGKPGTYYYGIHWSNCWRYDASLKSTLIKVRRVPDL